MTDNQKEAAKAFLQLQVAIEGYHEAVQYLQENKISLPSGIINHAKPLEDIAMQVCDVRMKQPVVALVGINGGEPEYLDGNDEDLNNAITFAPTLSDVLY